MSSAASKLAELWRGRAGFKDAVWPELGVPFKLMVLSNEDTQLCTAAAIERFKKIGLDVNMVTSDEFEAEVTLQILFRACRDPQDPWEKTIAIDADDMRRNTSPEQRDAVLGEYALWRKERDPRKEEMPRELWEEIEGLVKKKAPSLAKSFGSFLRAIYKPTSADQRPS